MKFNKLFLTFAAVTAVSAAMAVSASAMKATYNKTEAPNVVTLSNATLEPGENTIVLFKGKNAEVTTISSDIIKYINQGDSEQKFFIEIPVNTLDDGDYTVKVGGENGVVEVAEFNVSKTKDIKVGDVDDNNKINIQDKLKIARYVGKVPEGDTGLTGNRYTLAADPTQTYIIGDVDNNNKVNIQDKLKIARYVGKVPEGDTGLTNNTVTVIAQ